MEKNIKEEFISTLSHEIRTPLTSIKGFSQTMLSSWDKLSDEKKKEFLNIILNQSQRLINLVENVLNVAKIDSDSENFIPIKIDVNQITQNCINIVQMAHKDFIFKFEQSPVKIDVNQITQNCINIVQMAHKDFIFKFEQSKNKLFSLADNDKTQQILINILDNAAKYSNNSKVIEIKTFNKNDYNIFSIKNYGSYIKDEDIKKIFDKFYRVESYISSATQGSGLGLYIAKNLIDKMNGKIEVISSKEEMFCEFQIYLPVYEVEKLTKNIKI